MTTDCSIAAIEERLRKIQAYVDAKAGERQGSLDRERRHADRTFEIFRQSIDPGRAAALDESALGAPYIFPHHGVQRSAAFWTNAATSLRVQDIVRAQGMAEKPLRI